MCPSIFPRAPRRRQGENGVTFGHHRSVPGSRFALTPSQRDFIWTLVRTDFKVRYHGAASGFLWALLKPVAMFVVLFAVFSFIFRDQTYLFNLLIGLLLWDFFSEGTRTGLESLRAKGYLITAAPFPRSILVVTSISNALLTLVIFCVAIVTVVSIKRHVPSPAGAALFVLYDVLLAIIVVGFSLGASALFLKFRDLNQIWEVTLQAGFFVAPIIYPLGLVPEKYHFWLYAWPVTPIIQFSRSVLVDDKIPTLRAHLLLIGVALLIFTVGTLIFRKYVPRGVEHL
jgi:lipopolysaccharide transport system permease protein